MNLFFLILLSIHHIFHYNISQYLLLCAYSHFFIMYSVNFNCFTMFHLQSFTTQKPWVVIIPNLSLLKTCYAVVVTTWWTASDNKSWNQGNVVYSVLVIKCSYVWWWQTKNSRDASRVYCSILLTESVLSSSLPILLSSRPGSSVCWDNKI